MDDFPSELGETGRRAEHPDAGRGIEFERLR